MISDFTSNIQTNSQYVNQGMQALSEHFSALTTSKHRLDKMFINKCTTPVDNYSSCIENTEWKNDVSQFIPENTRKQCTKYWSAVRNCSTKFLGESYTINLDLMRQLQRPDESVAERNALEQYKNMMNNQFTFLKEDMPAEGDEE